MIGQLSHVLGEAGVNIAQMHNASRARYRLHADRLDSPASDSLVAAIGAIDGILSVRAIALRDVLRWPKTPCRTVFAARRSARAHRRHRPADPGADRRARRLGALQVGKAKGPLEGGGRVLPARARGAGAAHGRSTATKVRSADEVLVRCVPRDHVGVPRAAGAAEGRLSRSRRHVQRTGGAQAFRAFGARHAAGQHRGSVPGSRKRQCRFRRRAGRELGAGHDPDHARHVPDLAAQDLRRSRAARAPVSAVAHRAHRGHRAHLFASAVVRADARLAARQSAEGREDRGVEQRRSGAPRAQFRRCRGDRRRSGGPCIQFASKVIMGPIEDRDDNTTRFLVLGRQILPAVGPRSHVGAGVHQGSARRAVQRAESVRQARHQHEPHRIAAVASGEVGIRVLHRSVRPRRRRADEESARRAEEALGADQGARFVSGRGA